jgi:hypothetical protein
MIAAVLERPVSALGWELRGHMAGWRTVRLTLSERCDGVLPNPDGDRILEGHVTRVSPTDAFCIIAGRHVPLTEVLAVKRTDAHDRPASDPTDPLDEEQA